ncbi:PilZ domain-containing protein [Cellulomonas gilvus]|uniref:Type IV pilus assembly PilZ n=1 Tax=Cellulomonas gilvus (strain ATCC 13127 / NRRL B-14078) TaxID=593907 RepID=F8A0A2_CELGA|nr:PilZ domain-containing protein [Cellulomonas gilvus]AEI12666.1 type IV pilus assembly PilZ [Cellulomonas gilvus ATCC 13127]
MHELAACHVVTKTGTVVGFVERFEAGVMLIHVDEPPVDRRIGDEAQLVVLDPVQGECRYVGLLGGIGPDTVHVVVEDQVARHQRRSAARAYYRATCLGALERHAADDASGDGPDGAGALRLTVVDVSASGIRFASPHELAHGDVVRISLPVDDTALPLRARVLRIEESQSGWRYGCELLDLAERTREQLFRLVLRLHREEARARADR